MTEEERIFSGGLFSSEEPELVEKKQRAHRLSRAFNALYEEDEQARQAILRQLLGEVGEGTLMLGPIWFHYGCHTRVGSGCFMNCNFTVQDDAPVTIGSHCNFGPNVTIVTPLHPMLPGERRGLVCADGKTRFLCYAKPVEIGSDCWFGANVVVCPGVTVGQGCVIGAGSVVTRDIPPNSFAAACRRASSAPLPSRTPLQTFFQSCIENVPSLRAKKPPPAKTGQAGALFCFVRRHSFLRRAARSCGRSAQFST